MSVFRVRNQCPSIDIYYSDYNYSNSSREFTVYRNEKTTRNFSLTSNQPSEAVAWVGTACWFDYHSLRRCEGGLASDCKTGIMINCIKDNKYQSCYPCYREWRKLINVLVALVSASVSDSLMIDVYWWDRERSYLTTWWHEVGFPNKIKYFHVTSV